MSKFYVDQEGVITSAGDPVTILSTTAPGTHPIIGYSVGVYGSVNTYCWTLDGHYFLDKSKCGMNLVAPKRKITRTVWVNVYNDSVSPQETEWQAYKEVSVRKAHGGNEPLVTAHPVTFTVEVDG